LFEKTVEVRIVDHKWVRHFAGSDAGRLARTDTIDVQTLPDSPQKHLLIVSGRQAMPVNQCTTSCKNYTRPLKKPTLEMTKTMAHFAKRAGTSRASRQGPPD